MMSTELYPNQVLEICNSTNDLARSLGDAGYPHGTWVSSRTQTLGRGRLGREWVSPPGNIFFSYLARLSPSPLMSWIPLASALAVAESVQTLFPRADLKIKWPNDVWLSGNKLAGILCEGVGSGKRSFIVIGMGVNCGPLPEGVDQPTSSLLSLAPEQADLADQLRPILLGKLSAILDQLQSPGGVHKIRDDYCELALLQSHTEVEWTVNASPEKWIGTVIGLGNSGELRVLDENGKELSLWAEEVKLRLVLK